MYVDDVIFVEYDKTTVIPLKEAFMRKWECRDLGNLKEYLGMNIVQNNKGITIDQIDYAKKIVERFGQQNCKPTRTPLPAGYQPSKNTGKADSKQITY